MNEVTKVEDSIKAVIAKQVASVVVDTKAAEASVTAQLKAFALKYLPHTAVGIVSFIVGKFL